MKVKNANIYKKYWTSTIEVLEYKAEFVLIYNTLWDHYSIIRVELESAEHKIQASE